MNHPDASSEVALSVRGYITAVHAARVVIAILSLAIAVDTMDEIPTATFLGVLLPVASIAWTVTVAARWRRIEQLLARRPGAIWVDSVVLVGLTLVDKPWDSLVALPYAAFFLVVPYARPLHLALLVLVSATVSYAPKILLSAVDWRYTNLVPPVTTTEWFTLYVGPVFCGTVALALCLLFHGIRVEATARSRVQEELTRTQIRYAQAHAQTALANRLHETLSQVVRAIPLRLDGNPPEHLPAEAAATRAALINTALDARPAVQQLARDLRSEVPT